LKNTFSDVLELPNKDITTVQLIRTGDFSQYGEKIIITEETLREFKLNFDRRVRRVDIAVDYFHESYSDAAGWIKEIELRNNDTELWINVEWTSKAKQKILDKEIRYISADFSLHYEDSETKEEFGATLYGAGLTNRPYVKDMQAILHENQKLNEDKKMSTSFEDIMKSLSSLSDDEKLQLGEKLGFNKKTTDKNDKKMSEMTVKLSEADSKNSQKC